MAYAKQKRPKQKSRKNAPYASRKPRVSKRRYVYFVEPVAAKRTILTVIMLCIITVIFALFSSFLMDPERIAKQNFETISRDYYENYLYNMVVGASSKKKTLDEIMKKYESAGFAKVTLRQLLLHNNKKYEEIGKTIASYCDENETFIRIFPETPFNKSDYRIEYNYSCTF
ncbi:MAG: hypothetical protein Q4B65_01825 [Candidatus Saccharibacteria bacterium]|nr:hypothetical protein [Candidatus Saccharibacteria bacterium]